MPRILIVEDAADARRALVEWLERRDFTVIAAASVKEARAALESDEVCDLVLLDLELPDGNGLELLPVLEERSDAEVVIITGHGSTDSAIAAFRGGAVDYLEKPVDLERLHAIAGRFQRTFDLKQEIHSLQQELRSLGRFGEIIGRSQPIQHLYDMLARVATTSATVLIRGETGTGKELVAETLHRLSPRSGPFVALNCGAVTTTLSESELFGHEKGSFTGADRRHRGVFERAHGGTLFLDEISEMPLELQVRLLRVIETGQVSRVGSDAPIAADVRVIAASNRDLEQAVEAGTFRQDLFYRLNVFPLTVPPLRERSDDVDLLARHFLDQLNRKHDTDKRLTPAAASRLAAHGWPGNVRELKNLVERAYIMAEDRIDATHVPLPGVSAEPTTPAADGGISIAIGTTIPDAERALIEETLRHHGGNKQRTAKTLGISVKTLYNRLNSYEASVAAATGRGKEAG